MGKRRFLYFTPWSYHEHVNISDVDAYLFSINDKPVMEKLELEFSEVLEENNGYQKVKSTFTPKSYQYKG